MTAQTFIIHEETIPVGSGDKSKWNNCFIKHVYKLVRGTGKKQQILAEASVIVAAINDDLPLHASDYSLEMETVVDELFDEEGACLIRSNVDYFCFLELLKAASAEQGNGQGWCLLTHIIANLRSLHMIMGCYACPVPMLGEKESIEYTNGTKSKLLPKLLRFYRGFGFQSVSNKKQVLYL